MERFARRVLLVHGGVMVFFASLALANEWGLRLADVAVGPFARLRSEPLALLGFAEAHGVALILSFLLADHARRSPGPDPAFHLAGAALAGYLATCNVMWFEDAFAPNHAIGGFVVTTFVHVVFATLQAVCWWSRRNEARG